MDKILNKVIEIKLKEELAGQVRLTDEEGTKFTFWKKKQDGNPTSMYEQFKNMGLDEGSVVRIGYKESSFLGRDNKQHVAYNIINFQETSDVPTGTTSEKHPIGALNSPKVEQSYHPEKNNVPTQAYWQKQGRMKALCGMINAQLSFGVKPLDINVPQLTALVEEVEKEASEIISTEELKVESEGWQKLDSEPPF